MSSLRSVPLVSLARVGHVKFADVVLAPGAGRRLWLANFQRDQGTHSRPLQPPDWTQSESNCPLSVARPSISHDKHDTPLAVLVQTPETLTLAKT